jgi:hypothetical protein
LIGVRALVATFALFHSACVIQTITTEVAFKDPSQVELARDDKTVIAAGSGETTQPLASGRAETNGASAGYEASAVRTPDAALWIEWATKLPLADGERSKVLGKEPLVFSEPLTELFSETTLAAPRFALPMCATIAYRWTRYSGTWRADAHAVEGGCTGSVVVPYRLETDWSNVVIHEKTRVNKGLAWMTIALSIGAFTPFAVIIDTAHPSEIAGGKPTQIGFTIGIGALVAAFSGAVLPTLFASDNDVYVRR